MLHLLHTIFQMIILSGQLRTHIRAECTVVGYVMLIQAGGKKIYSHEDVDKNRSIPTPPQSVKILLHRHVSPKCRLCHKHRGSFLSVWCVVCVCLQCEFPAQLFQKCKDHIASIQRSGQRPGIQAAQKFVWFVWFAFF